MIKGFIKKISDHGKSKSLNSLSQLNGRLLSYDLCLLQNSVDKKDIKKITKLLNSNLNHQAQEKELMIMIGKSIFDHKHRSYQSVYRYRQLHIFKSFSKVIDFASISMVSGNWACAYFTMLPVVGEILKKWLMVSNHGEDDYKTLMRKIKNKILLTKEELDELKSKNAVPNKKLKLKAVLKTADGDCYARLKYFMSLYRYLLLVLRDIYKNNDFANHILSNKHLSDSNLKDNKYFCTPINSLRLLIALDVIAELYLWSNRFDYSILTTDFDNKFNNKLYKKYQKFYSGVHYNDYENSLLKNFYS